MPMLIPMPMPMPSGRGAYGADPDPGGGSSWGWGPLCTNRGGALDWIGLAWLHKHEQQGMPSYIA
jgi:hypothetical protein